MISLFLILCLGFTVFFIIKAKKEYNDTGDENNSYTFISVITGVATIVFLIWVGILGVKVGTAPHIIDDKISMYQTENASIEESIDATVKNYMQYEKDAYAQFKDEDAINLVSLFPELKSDILVQKQIEVYVENNTKIKELKEEKIELSKARFKLYFGR